MDEHTRTYCPLLAPAALRSVPPLKGLWEPRAAILSYRASVPVGHDSHGVTLFYRTSVPAGHRNERGFRRSGCRRRNGAHRTCCPCGGRQPFPESKFLCRRILVMAGTHHSAKRGSVERNLQNHSHPHPPAVPCPLTPVRWTFTFSAKEKDSETGFSYFGSRYYSSDLSIWLSVDPMSGKYPSLSPYVYCADNPIKLVDPNGEEIGEYRAWNGNLLGTDGKNDWNIFFVSDEGSIDIIKKNEAANRATNRSDVKVDWETNKMVTYMMEIVYYHTVNNGGGKEEAVTFPGKNRLPKFYPTGYENGEIDIDSQGYLSIHSHKLKEFECPDGKGTCVQTPSVLSTKDKTVFPNYTYNIVVGNSYEEVQNFTTGSVYKSRTGVAVIYDSRCVQIGEIHIDDLKKIKF